MGIKRGTSEQTNAVVNKNVINDLVDRIKLINSHQRQYSASLLRALFRSPFEFWNEMLWDRCVVVVVDAIIYNVQCTHSIVFRQKIKAHFWCKQQLLPSVCLLGFTIRVCVNFTIIFFSRRILNGFCVCDSVQSYNSKRKMSAFVFVWLFFFLVSSEAASIDGKSDERKEMQGQTHLSFQQICTFRLFYWKKIWILGCDLMTICIISSVLCVCVCW